MLGGGKRCFVLFFPVCDRPRLRRRGASLDQTPIDEGPGRVRLGRVTKIDLMQSSVGSANVANGFRLNHIRLEVERDSHRSLEGAAVDSPPVRADSRLRSAWSIRIAQQERAGPIKKGDRSRVL